MYELVATTGPGVMIGHVVTDLYGVMQIVNNLIDENVTVLVCLAPDHKEPVTLH